MPTTDFTLLSEKFTNSAPDRTPEHIAECCKWYEDMLTLNHPQFKELTFGGPQDDYYRCGVVKSMGWQFIAADPVRVFVNEGDSWVIRYVPTRELAERYIKKYSSIPGHPIFWFFYDIDSVNMIETDSAEAC